MNAFIQKLSAQLKEVVRLQKKTFIVNKGQSLFKEREQVAGIYFLVEGPF